MGGAALAPSSKEALGPAHPFDGPGRAHDHRGRRRTWEDALQAPDHVGGHSWAARAGSAMVNRMNADDLAASYMMTR